MNGSLFTVCPLVDIECVTYVIQYNTFQNHKDNYGGEKNQNGKGNCQVMEMQKPDYSELTYHRRTLVWTTGGQG